VTADEIGRSLATVADGIGVRVHRGGVPIAFWEPGAAALQAGDTIIEIVKGDGRPA
jgi:voltage-gated potassium channel